MIVLTGLEIAGLSPTPKDASGISAEFRFEVTSIAEPKTLFAWMREAFNDKNWIIRKRRNASIHVNHMGMHNTNGRSRRDARPYFSKMKTIGDPGWAEATMSRVRSSLLEYVHAMAANP